jgi:hypothetical protein
MPETWNWNPVLNVIYILADVRSGSTLLDMLLGNTGSVCSAGEVHRFKELWNGRDRFKGQCTCGDRIQDCPFWKPIGKRLEEQEHSPSEFNTWLPHSELLHQLLGEPGGTKPECKQAMDNSILLMDAIAAEHGYRWIVDSSKYASRALYYARHRPQRGEFKVIFLHRRGIGNAYSKAIRGEIPLIRAVLSWVKISLQNTVAFLRIPGENRYFVTYEGLCEEQESTVHRILCWMGLSGRGLDCREQHNLGGSPHRFNANATELRPDTRYASELSLFQKVWVRAITLPVELLVRWTCRMKTG